MNTYCTCTWHCCHNYSNKWCFNSYIYCICLFFHLMRISGIDHCISLCDNTQSSIYREPLICCRTVHYNTAMNWGNVSKHYMFQILAMETSKIQSRSKKELSCKWADFIGGNLTCSLSVWAGRAPRCGLLLLGTWRCLWSDTVFS